MIHPNPASSTESNPAAQPSDMVAGRPRAILRLEGLALLAASIIAYSQTGLSWGWFALFFLAPDLSFLGYLAGPRPGSVIYNIVHSLALPLFLLCIGVIFHLALPIAAAIIWAGHIGMDRFFGFGLKYSDSFQHTHLGMLKGGRKKVA